MDGASALGGGHSGEEEEEEEELSASERDPWGQLLPDDLLEAVLENLRDPLTLSSARLACKSFARVGKVEGLVSRQMQLQEALLARRGDPEKYLAILRRPEARRVIGRMPVLNLSGAMAPEKCLEKMRLLAPCGGGRLRELDLRCANLSGATCRAFVALDLVRGLRSLDLSYCHVGAAEMGLLAQAPGLAALTTLNLRENRIGARGALCLAESATLTSLTDLDLGHNQIGVQGTRHLTTAAPLKGLIGLNLDTNGVGNEGAIFLVRFAVFTGLTSLSLRSNNITIDLRFLIDRPRRF